MHMWNRRKPSTMSHEHNLGNQFVNTKFNSLRVGYPPTQNKIIWEKLCFMFYNVTHNDV